MLKVNDIFYSIQGEGPHLGTPSVFIRLAGCNLSCKWCDTEYKSFEKYNEDKIVNKVSNISNSCKTVVISGGEPLLQPILNLVKLLIQKGYSIHIETNGTIYKSELIGFCKFIVSPKLLEVKTIEQYNKYIETLSKWNSHCHFKFVISDEFEFIYTLEALDKLKPKNTVYFMPKCDNCCDMRIELTKLVNLVKYRCPHIAVTPRLHIYLYGNKRGT